MDTAADTFSIPLPVLRCLLGASVYAVFLFACFSVQSAKLIETDVTQKAVNW
jgi:hypothetical protein